MSLRYKLIDKEGYLACAKQNMKYFMDYFKTDCGGDTTVVLHEIGRNRTGISLSGESIISRNELKFFKEYKPSALRSELKAK